MASEGLSRRGFLSGAALAGAALATAGLAGCAPKTRADKAADEAASAGTTTVEGTMGYDGSGTMPWLGEAPAISDSDVSEELDADVVVVVLAVAGIGMWTWHETPGFCGAICHTPMADYLTAYEQEAGTTGVDKWGNEVSDTSALLAVAHAQSEEDGGADAECLDCHTPVISEQLSEAANWVTGNYCFPLDERSSTDLTEASGTEGDSFCLNESCHNITRDDLVELTSDRQFNPHVAQHGEQECTTCHKAHRASVYYCTNCHNDVDMPEGWVSYSDGQEIMSAALDA